MLTSQVNVSPCTNITIVGVAQATVMCENNAYVLFYQSHDIVIENITWSNCGLNGSLYIGQLSCNYCSNINITNSVFQNSSSAGVTLIGVDGNIIVKGSIFKFNSGNHQAGGMLISTGTGKVNASFNLVISTSSFYSNNAFCPDDLQCSGGLYINIPSDSVNKASLHIEKSNFTSHNVSGSGAVLIAAGTGNLAVSISDVLFSNNFGMLAGAMYLFIKISSSNVSSDLSLNFTSTKFVNNGGAILNGFVNKCVQISMSNVTFSNNIPAGSLYTSNVILELEENCTAFLDVSDCIFQGNTINVFTIFTCQTVIANFSNILVDNNTGQGGITVLNSRLCNSEDDVSDSEHNAMQQLQMINRNHRINFAYSNFTNNNENVGVIYISAAADSINITNCSFINNYAYDGVVVIRNTPDIAVQYSEFISNNASGLYLIQSYITHIDHIVFRRNSASNGGGIALMKKSLITLGDNTYLEFLNNFAIRYGGAIYAEIPYGIKVISGSKPILSFINNSAGLAGYSVYFKIPNSCESASEDFNILLSSLRCLYCIGANASINSNFLCYEFMRSSPMKLVSNDTSNCNSNNAECFFDINVMLGEEVTIPLKVIDYFNQTAEPTVFLITSDTNGYKLEGTSSKFTIIQNSFSGIRIIGKNPGMSKKNVTINLSTVEVSDTRPITLLLKLSLMGCHTGFVYNNNQSKCVCFSKYDIVRCVDNVRSEIARGYWFGYVKSKGKLTASLSTCPNNYCKFVKCSSDNNKMCTLHPNLQHQCHAHRTGVACSKCESSYTLSYDSTVCISDKKCTVGYTALVVILTVFYWIIIIGLVFLVLSFKLRVSYLFAIIYFYSIVDLLIGDNLYISNGVFQTVTLLSSFAKLSPQFLGKLCLVEGMSGIDQLFIHYCHPIAILIMLIVIAVVARYSLRVSNFISFSIIRAICLLLLLSYTSIASTSLLLLRHLKFTDVDGVYTYSSPEIEFFNGRHILYGGVAVFCEVMIGIGLPLLLILDPYISYKINLVKIRPLLDQFQGGYKDKYRWCAAYYLICRQIIFLLVYLTTVHNHEQMNFVLLVVCAAIAVFHAWIQPYAEEALNSLDEVILVSSVVIVGLNGAAFSTEALAKMIVGFVFFPLLSFAGFLLSYSSIKRKIVGIFVYVAVILHCECMQQKSNIQDDGALDNYDQYDRNNGSYDENQPLLPNSSRGSILRYEIS